MFGFALSAAGQNNDPSKHIPKNPTNSNSTKNTTTYSSTTYSYVQINLSKEALEAVLQTVLE